MVAMVNRLRHRPRITTATAGRRPARTTTVTASTAIHTGPNDRLVAKQMPLSASAGQVHWGVVVGRDMRNSKANTATPAEISTELGDGDAATNNTIGVTAATSPAGARAEPLSAGQRAKTAMA